MIILWGTEWILMIIHCMWCWQICSSRILKRPWKKHVSSWGKHSNKGLVVHSNPTLILTSYLTPLSTTSHIPFCQINKNPVRQLLSELKFSLLQVLVCLLLLYLHRMASTVDLKGPGSSHSYEISWTARKHSGTHSSEDDTLTWSVNGRRKPAHTHNSWEKLQLSIHHRQPSWWPHCRQHFAVLSWHR